MPAASAQPQAAAIDSHARLTQAHAQRRGGRRSAQQRIPARPPLAAHQGPLAVGLVQHRTLSTYGTEASAEWKPWVWHTMDATLTPHQGRYDDGDGLWSLPPVLASGRMHIEPLGVEKLTVTPAVRYCAGYQGKRGHGIVDLAVIYRISASVSAFASLLNALDERLYAPYVVEQADAFLRDSRALRLGLTAELGQPCAHRQGPQTKHRHACRHPRRGPQPPKPARCE